MTLASADSRILVTICARKGSKGVPSKNIRPLLGKPLIAYSIELALRWPLKSRVIVSTDSKEIARIAREFGAEAPFMRPAELASDTAAKLPVLSHALREAERIYGERYDVVVDLDPTAPVRSLVDLDAGWKVFKPIRRPVFSVVKARKNPYFNMVERDAMGHIGTVKKPQGALTSRQSAPAVWDMNASIYFYPREFLLSDPLTLWKSDPEIFEMPAESAFDIDEERDFLVVEALMARGSRPANP